MIMNEKRKLQKLRKIVYEIYEDQGGNLLFHGWHHLKFVAKKAVEFAKPIGADEYLVETSALLHDLNYLVKVNTEPEEGDKVRNEILKECGYSEEEIQRIDEIIKESHTRTRGTRISDEGKALSDADSVFKILPITALVLPSRYVIQNKVDLKKLAKKIVEEQKPLLKKGIYFYTDLAKKKYMKWARSNLQIWFDAYESLNDNDVKELLRDMRNLGFI